MHLNRILWQLYFKNNFKIHSRGMNTFVRNWKSWKFFQKQKTPPNICVTRQRCSVSMHVSLCCCVTTEPWDWGSLLSASVCWTPALSDLAAAPHWLKHAISWLLLRPDQASSWQQNKCSLTQRCAAIVIVLQKKHSRRNYRRTWSCPYSINMSQH